VEGKSPSIHDSFAFLIVRVISGSLKGHTLFVPKGHKIRPTSDHVKESLFNMIGPEIPHTTFLDLFAGTGNIGIEALSRDAKQVIFVEKSPVYVRVLRRNLAACAVESRSIVYCRDANKILRVLQKAAWRFDVIFLDPPYHQTNMLRDILEKIADLSIVSETGMIVAEHAHTFTPQSNVGGKLVLTRNHRIGDTRLSFYRSVADNKVCFPKTNPPHK
jgi:16S rRNA (guanine(966)-N(2))-methyltransferase RsmD